MVSAELTIYNVLTLLCDTAKRFGHKTDSIDDLLQFLLHVDANLLTNVSVMGVYKRGTPRKELNKIWTPIPEGIRMAAGMTSLPSTISIFFIFSVPDAFRAFMTKPAHRQMYDLTIKQNIDTMFGYTSAVTKLKMY